MPSSFSPHDSSSSPSDVHPNQHTPSDVHHIRDAPSLKFESCPGSEFQVRGEDYITSGIKITSGESLYDVCDVKWVKTEKEIVTGEYLLDVLEEELKQLGGKALFEYRGGRERDGRKGGDVNIRNGSNKNIDVDNYLDEMTTRCPASSCAEGSSSPSETLPAGVSSFDPVAQELQTLPKYLIVNGQCSAEAPSLFSSAPKNIGGFSLISWFKRKDRLESCCGNISNRCGEGSVEGGVGGCLDASFSFKTPNNSSAASSAPSASRSIGCSEEEEEDSNREQESNSNIDGSPLASSPRLTNGNTIGIFHPETATTIKAIKLFKKMLDRGGMENDKAVMDPSTGNFNTKGVAFKASGAMSEQLVSKLGLGPLGHRYNGKPALIVKTGRIVKRSNAVAIDIDVRKWSYICRQSLHSVCKMDLAKSARFRIGYLCEGRCVAQLPEQVLGCFYAEGVCAEGACLVEEPVFRGRKIVLEEEKIVGVRRTGDSSGVIEGNGTLVTNGMVAEDGAGRKLSDVNLTLDEGEHKETNNSSSYQSESDSKIIDIVSNKTDNKNDIKKPRKRSSDCSCVGGKSSVNKEETTERLEEKTPSSPPAKSFFRRLFGGGKSKVIGVH